MSKTHFDHVIKRDGSVVPFTDVRITNAIYRAAIAVGGRDRKIAEYLTNQVISYLNKNIPPSKSPHVEQIQNTIERVLIERGYVQTAKAFILYRNERQKNREEKQKQGDSPKIGDGIPWKKVWESLNWAIDHKVFTIEELNERILDGSYQELVRESEEAYQLDIIRAADTILKRKAELCFVIVAGPSSSGKTTTTVKIAEHLKNEGLEFLPFHVDNYFFDLEDHPRDEHGDYDYETPEAIDIKLLNEHLQEIYKGKEVQPPCFNFKSGKREGTTHPVKLHKNQILLIDCLHGLHKPLTAGIPDSAKAKIYIEPFFQIRGPDGSFIKWTDIRLIRRIVRDQRERNVSPNQSIEHWHYVRKAELRYIIPHSTSADYIINSALPYELPVWSNRVGKLFKEWKKLYKTKGAGYQDPAKRAERISGILEHIKPWQDESIIPETALLREFIGGSYYLHHQFRQ
ncbi:MAG: ATP cone domain-containing protein [Candidatus Hydrogenedentota bacterium]